MAAHKHQAEAEVHSTFSYAPREQRIAMYERCREICWALDMAWLSGQGHVWPVVAAFVRFFRGPIHMTMRRYRFVEDGLTIGKALDDEIIQEARRSVKLWYRLEGEKTCEVSDHRYAEILARKEELMFPELGQILSAGNDEDCERCQFVEKNVLCHICQKRWTNYLESLLYRAQNAFPEINGIFGNMGSDFL